eukprot:TRINITY_DN12888_c0_g1_i1.p1 TRINITY_DN12888_c0_g1~~TRINITY_DN12888_c0_g1_i1.p1  ORF type:complete len:154 (-),score=30.87 TRINITY_DN12888_c0_g1_i1:273-734(-)
MFGCSDVCSARREGNRRSDQPSPSSAASLRRSRQQSAASVQHGGAIAHVEETSAPSSLAGASATGPAALEVGIGVAASARAGEAAPATAEGADGDGLQARLSRQIQERIQELERLRQEDDQRRQLLVMLEREAPKIQTTALPPCGRRRTGCAN